MLNDCCLIELDSRKGGMPDYRQPIQEYMRVCEALLKINELSNEEAEAVEEMFG